MNRILSLVAVIGLALAVSACKPAPAPAPEQKNAATKTKPATEKVPAKAEALKAPAAKAAPEKAAAATENKAVDKAADNKTEEVPADPDDENGKGTWDSDTDKIDREKLAKTYTEVYCAQKTGDMDKLLEIYKANGFEKPDDFISTWVEAARDTAWVTKVATEAAKKCRK